MSLTYPRLTAQIAGNTAGATAYLSTGTVVFAGGNNVTLSQNGQTVTISAGGGGAGDGYNIIAAGTQTAQTTGTVVFANSNGLTFGMSGSSQVTGSYTVPSQTNQTLGLYASSNTTAQSSSSTVDARSLSIVGAGNISVGLSAGSFIVSATGGGAGDGYNIIAAGTQTAQTTGTVVFANSNGLTFGMSNSSQVTASYTVPSTAGLISAINLSAGTTSQNLSKVTFADSNGVSWGLNGSQVTATVKTDYLTSQSNQAFSASGGSSAFQTLGFSNANGVTFSNSNGSVVASYTVPSTAGLLSAINVSAGTTSNNGSAFVFQNSNGLAFGLNGSTVTGSYTVPTQSNQTLGGYAVGNTTGQSSSSTFDARTLSFNGAGNVSVGYSAGSVVISGGTAAASPVNVSAGTTSGNLGTIVFSNSNGVSFGLNGSTVTGSANTVGTATTVYSLATANSLGTVTRWAAEDHRHGMLPMSTYEPFPAQGLSTVLVGVPTATSAAVSVYPFQVGTAVSAGILNLAASVSFVTNGTSSGRQTMGLAVGLYTLNGSTLSSVQSTSLSWQVTGQNSTYSINQVTATDYTGYAATNSTTSAGVNITSGYTGMKLIGIPVNTLLTPGQYFLGVLGTNSTSSVNVGLSMSLLGAAMGTGLSGMAPIGSFSTAYTAGIDPNGGRWNIGQGTWTSAGSVTMLPASMNMTSVRAVGLTYPLMRFWST